MKTEQFFEQAVNLAAAFVANGDIRLGGNTGQNAQAQEMLLDLIPTLCRTLARAHAVTREDQAD